ncbi:MAG: DNA repair exonuclease [Candidatus Woesearchaeota archaeon]
MIFAHLADCHLGGWREPKLRAVNTKAFASVIDYCIEAKTDFIIISGDLFNNSLPAMDCLKVAVDKLRQLKERHIPVYMIAGSHDFSPSGKTMLDVLESAGLITNVCRGEETADGKLKLKFTIDKNTGTKITGLLGKKGGLEKNYFYNLDREELEKREKTFKIFMFHSAITELKTKDMGEMESMPISLLPKGFNYYAGGHVHIVDKQSLPGYLHVVYPGPVFPNSFSELEKLKHGSFVVFKDHDAMHLKVEPYPVISIILDCENKTPAEVEDMIMKELEGKNLKDAIITIRLSGVLSSGKQTEIRFKEIFDKLYAAGAYFVMKNTNKLSSKEFQEIKVSKNSVEEIEESTINEHAGQLGIFSIDKERELAKELIRILSVDKDEGEKSADFEKRIKADVDALLKI